jgi:hypothetical protein
MPSENRITDRVFWALFLVAILVGIVGRGVIILDRKGVIHDDVISLIMATGHQDELMRATLAGDPPFETWVPAAEWKRFIEPEDEVNLGAISRDLARYDTHPPLYFWLLRLWMVIVGATVPGALALNLLFDLLGLVAVFALADAVFKDRHAALAVTVIWFMSPGDWMAFYIRQYAVFNAGGACVGRFRRLHLIPGLRERETAGSRGWLDRVMVVSGAAVIIFIFLLVCVGGLLRDITGK